MFSNKKNAPVQTGAMPDPNLVNVITTGTKVTGEIVSNSDFRIDGKLKGNITTQGKIILRDTGEIEGNVKSVNADIYGKVVGNIVIDEVLSVKSTGKIEGDVKTNKLAIEVGAIFNVTCDMSQGRNNSLVSEKTKREGR